MLKIIHDKTQWDQYYFRLYNPSIYGSYQYCTAASMVEDDGIAELAVFDSKNGICFHPYIKRKINLPGGYYDLISPYDFGGFWFSDDHSVGKTEVFNNFSKAFSEYCQDSLIASEFIRFYPFSSQIDHPFYNTVMAGNNIIVDLKQAEEEINSAYPSSLRGKLRQAKSYGLRMDKNIRLQEFVTLYHKNLDFLNSDSYYYFPLKFFQSLPGIDIVCVKDTDGNICASHLYLKDGQVIFYFLSGSNRDFIFKNPNDLLLNDMFFESKKNGFKIMHMGGGRKKSLLDYKKKFSKKIIPYYIGKKIYLAEVYDMLVHSQEKKAGKELDSVDFFPLYRYTSDQ